MLNRACEMQVAALSMGGIENLIQVDPQVIKAAEMTHKTLNPEGLGRKEWTALLRSLDEIDPSYKL
jgi:hypothetical protein